ncbi:sensor domain-containing diguanylate cyclase [Malaciobacter marinus]|uniref:sensor domain-containing diguanylate cyclase n=1 Tax=Malaciobacter marinus TaxID=505249 RepID=UPI003C2ED735
MTKKRKLKVIFISSFFILLTLMYNFSHKYFIGNYEVIETIHNKKSIENLVKNLNMQLDFINTTAKIYSKWDDAYDFLANKNHKFAYRNFRNNKILENLPVDFIFYTDLKNNIKLKFSSLNHNSKFYDKVVKLLPIDKETQSVFLEKSNIYYVLKSKVLQTDYSGKKTGYMYAGKLFDKNLFNYINSNFYKIDLVQKELYNYDSAISYNSLNNIRYKVEKTKTKIINYLEIRDDKNKYIVTIKAISDRDYMMQGRNTILLFNIIIAVILLIIFYFSYRCQIILESNTQKLEYSVAKRTNELEKSNKELHDLAYKDYLTKLDNRRSFFSKVQRLLKDTVFRKDLVHIVMIDIDNFKQINDTYSHDVGDVVLKKFAQILKNNISNKDICARLGGEEFVIAFHNLKTKEVLEKVERIRKETEETPIIVNKDKTFNFTASFGISDNRKSNNIDKILHTADSYLYEVKTTGKNNIRYR